MWCYGKGVYADVILHMAHVCEDLPGFTLPEHDKAGNEAIIRDEAMISSDTYIVV